MNKFIDRLKEPSTWNAFAIVLGVIGLSGAGDFLLVNGGIIAELIAVLLAIVGGAVNPEKGALTSRAFTVEAGELRVGESLRDEVRTPRKSTSKKK